ncbi:MAG: hypothetical protein ACLFUX_05355 [Spirochaetaceae bacterium]
MQATDRRRAQKRFRIFWILNAVPVALFLDDILILYGIRNGRTAVVLAGAFVFAVFRAVGVINMHPLNGEITTEQERGRDLILATRVFDSTWIYQVMIGCGSAAIMLVKNGYGVDDYAVLVVVAVLLLIAVFFVQRLRVRPREAVV